MVLRALDRKRYASSEVRIHKSGLWQFLPERKRFTISAAVRRLKRDGDVVFIALHGKFGEDGTLQALLQRQRIPFTGSGQRASRLAMDKIASDRIFQRVGLTIPSSTVLKSNQEIPKHITFPVVVKPVRGGSSVGISIARTPTQLLSAIRLARREDARVLLQQYVAGRELTCGVLEKHGQPFALTPTEIIPKAAAFFDYRAKYHVGGSRELTPPRLSPTWIRRVKKAALTAHRALGCRGLSRTDFILSKGKLYVLEINTIPGMTPTSLLSRDVQHDGYSFGAMLDLIIGAALHRS